MAIKKAIVAVYPCGEPGDDDEWTWTFGVNGRPYAESPVVYSRKGDARGSAARFAKWLDMEVEVVVTPESPFNH